MMKSQIDPCGTHADRIQGESQIIQRITKFALLIALSIQQRILTTSQYHMCRVAEKMCQDCTGITQSICTVNNHKILDLSRLQFLNKLHQLQPVRGCAGTTVFNGWCAVAFNEILVCEYLFELGNK